MSGPPKKLSAATEALRDTQGNRVISRYFNVGNDPLLLAVNVPPRRAYRKLTNKAVQEIQRIWET